MAVRATRSASGSSGDGSRCLLLALSHDELGVIFDGLADPFQPVMAVALSSTCEGLRTPLHAALQVLQQRRGKGKALCQKVNRVKSLRKALSDTIFADLPRTEHLNWYSTDLTAEDMATLAMLMHWMPKLESLSLTKNGFSDAGAKSLFGGMCRDAAPSLTILSLYNNKVGFRGAEALASALCKGALPKLEQLFMGRNPIGVEGTGALTVPLRKRPALKLMDLTRCGLGDEGTAALVANLGKDDFKGLTHLDLEHNALTDVGCKRLVDTLRTGALPALVSVFDVDMAEVLSEQASEAALEAVEGALEPRRRFGEAPRP